VVLSHRPHHSKVPNPSPERSEGSQNATAVASGGWLRGDDRRISRSFAEPSRQPLCRGCLPHPAPVKAAQRSVDPVFRPGNRRRAGVAVYSVARLGGLALTAGRWCRVPSRAASEAGLGQTRDPHAPELLDVSTTMTTPTYSATAPAACGARWMRFEISAVRRPGLCDMSSWPIAVTLPCARFMRHVRARAACYADQSKYKLGGRGHPRFAFFRLVAKLTGVHILLAPPRSAEVTNRARRSPLSASGAARNRPFTPAPPTAVGASVQRLPPPTRRSPHTVCNAPPALRAFGHRARARHGVCCPSLARSAVVVANAAPRVAPWPRCAPTRAIAAPAQERRPLGCGMEGQPTL